MPGVHAIKATRQNADSYILNVQLLVNCRYAVKYKISWTNGWFIDIIFFADGGNRFFDFYRYITAPM